MYSKNLWDDEPALITTLDDIVGKTVVRAVKRKSKDGRIKLLQIAFSGYTYCVIVADNPSVDINLMDDTERAIPEAFKEEVK